MEFETNTCQDPVELENILKNEMPKGLDIKWCGRLEESVKSLAAEAQKAEYEIIIPVCIKQEDLEKALSGYLAQEQIIAMKRRKKDKKMIQVDIKDKIRDLTGKSIEENIALSMVLDWRKRFQSQPGAGHIVLLQLCYDRCASIHDGK